jgi:L-lactate dehydrogenase complex protein LldG
MTARETILARIRAANAAAAATPVTILRDYRRTGDFPAGHPQLLDLFTVRLTDYGGAVHRCKPETLAATLARICGDGTVVTPVPILCRFWRWTGLTLSSPAVR